MLFEKIQLEPGEELLKTVRKHWFVIVMELFGSFVMLLLPFFLLFFVLQFPDAISAINIDLSNYISLITFTIASWSIFSLMAGFMIWTHYYLDFWIITDRRIILVNQIHFFNRNVSIFRLERLQDIEFTVKGFIPTLLNFGEISAQTASAFESNFRTRGMPDPRGLQAIIQKAMDKRLVVLHSTPDLAE